MSNYNYSNGRSDHYESRGAKYARLAMESIQYMRANIARETQKQLLRTSALYRALHDEDTPEDRKRMIQENLPRFTRSNTILEQMNARFNQYTERIIKSIRNREYTVDELVMIANDPNAIFDMENTPIPQKEAEAYRAILDKLHDANHTEIVNRISRRKR